MTCTVAGCICVMGWATSVLAGPPGNGGETSISLACDRKIPAQGDAEFRFDLEGVNTAQVNEWAQRLVQRLQSVPEVRNATTDAGAAGLSAMTSSRLNDGASCFGSFVYPKSLSMRMTASLASGTTPAGRSTSSYRFPSMTLPGPIT